MSSVVINGDTSGSITLQAPAVAGTNTLTLPANTGTVLTSASSASDLPSSIKGPAFSAYQSSSQTISTNTLTKVQFQTEEFDTASCFDNSTNYRFTPNIAGYYQVGAAVNLSAQTWMDLQLFKNGSNFKQLFYSYSSSVSSAQNSVLIYMNGSTDYLEVYVRIGAGQGLSANANISTYFQASMVRSA